MKWLDLVLTVCKSECRLAFLDSLWKGPRKLNRTGVNYKTTLKISKEFIELGLISSDERRRYSLTPLGKFLACFLLGKFKGNPPEPEEINAYLDKEELFVGRRDVVKEILTCVKLKRDVVILGENGIGKTALLKYLKRRYLPEAIYVYSRPPSKIIEEIARSLDIPTKKRRMVDVLDDIERAHHSDTILLVDELERATKQTVYLLRKLRRMNFTIIGAGTEYPKSLEFYKEIRLRELSKKEARALVISSLRKELKEIPDDLINLITNHTGNPEKLGLYCTQAILLHREGELKTREDVHKHFGEPIFAKKFVLIPRSSFLPLAFLLISFRFLLYGTGNFRLGYWVAMVAYLMYFLRSLKRN